MAKKAQDEDDEPEYMEESYNEIQKTYEFRESDFPKVEKSFLFWTRSVITEDESELIRLTTRQRVDVTQSILKTLEEALGKKVEIAGIKVKDFPVELAFSNMGLGGDDQMDFRLVDNKRKDIGEIGYFFPHWEDKWITDYVDYAHHVGKSLVTGGVNLLIFRSTIKNGTQYNALRTGLRKVQST